MALKLRSPFKEREPTPTEVSWLRLVRASMRAAHVTNEGSRYDGPHIRMVEGELHKAHASHFRNIEGAS